MKPKPPLSLKAWKARLGRIYRRKYRTEILERKRARYYGRHRDWMRNAFLKAGGSLSDWPVFRRVA